MKKLLSILLLFICTSAHAVKYDLNDNDTINGVDNPAFAG
ncbi:unnamed protein product, partial [marine sediment metagenome]